MNVMVPGDNDYPGSIRIEELFTESAEKLASFAILSGHLGVGIRSVPSRTLDQITAYHDQLWPRDAFQVPSCGITDERRENLIVA